MESEHRDLSPGVLLLAAPMLADPNFSRTVILLCEHSLEGSFGLVLNRMIDVEPGDLMEALGGLDADVGYGGPVQLETLHYVHTFGEDVPGSIQVTDDLWWGGDFASLGDVVKEAADSAKHVRFFLGYSGWESGQLNAEMEQGSWLTADARADLLFDVAPDAVWRTILLEKGGVYALMANFPLDPRLN